MEADLLDQRMFREWLDLLADDLVYFMPIRRNVKFGQHAEKENTRQGEGISWFDEDKWTLGKRVEQILTGVHYAEEPLSRVTHMVSNVRLLEVAPSLGRPRRGRRRLPLPGLPEPRRIRNQHLRRPPHRHAAPARRLLADRAARNDPGTERPDGEKPEHPVLRERHAMLVVNDVAVGTKLLIAGGLTAEVIENMGDGEWLRVRMLSGDDAGAEELCHATDVLEVA